MCPNEAKSDDNLWGIGAYSLINEIPSNKGIYIIVFRNDSNFYAIINKKFYQFEKGFLIYIGSAGNGLRNRIGRHVLKKGKIKWHIDYISHRKEIIPIIIYYSIGSYGTKFEDNISKIFYSRFQHIDMLGSTDSTLPHLYFSNNISEIIDILLNLEGSIIILSRFFE